MRFGKLSADELQSIILDNLHHTRSELVLPPAQGEDCAALKLDGLILISTDPITAKMPLENLGALGIDVACNDIAANGGEPVIALLTIIMPSSYKSSDVEIIMKSASMAAKKINIDIAGGHTEFSDSVNWPILSVTAIGKASRLIKKSDIKAGDKLFITKFAAMEGTVILAKNNKNLLEKGDNAVVECFERDLSVIRDGKILSEFESVSSMHDITEGGVLGAVAEICLNAKVGAKIYADKIPLHPLTKRLCHDLGLNPYKLISSGSMMFTGKNLDEAVSALKGGGIQAVQIGEITADLQVIFQNLNGEKEVVKTEPDQLFKNQSKEGAL